MSSRARCISRRRGRPDRRKVTPRATSPPSTAATTSWGAGRFRLPGSGLRLRFLRLRGFLGLLVMAAWRRIAARARQRGEQRRAIRAAPARAGVPTGAGLVDTVVALGNVVESFATGSVQRGIGETQ